MITGMSKQRWNALARKSLQGVSVFYLLCPLQELRAHSHCSSWTGMCPSAETPPTFLMEKYILMGKGDFCEGETVESPSLPWLVISQHTYTSPSGIWSIPARNFFQGVTDENSHKTPLSGSCLMTNEDLQYKKTLKVFFTSFTAVFFHHTF